MKLLKQINLMDNQKTIKRLNLAAIPSFIFFYVFFTFLTVAGHGATNEPPFFIGLLILMVAYFILIIIHELIHGAFFKLFDPKGKVKFGFKNGVAYATSPHSFYSKEKFAIILLAPFLGISVGLFLFYLFGWLTASLFTLIAAAHAASCVGDFYFLFLIVRAPVNSCVEDTEVGLNIYHEE
ncbi:DUF3267 domain-containing protein [Enterococcus casseliflavus]|uniref:DUF3267 domain-containing protein n=1 Tax=Enterococcus casseliflavus TaxID=37734 RepID=UPI001918FD43|nr:DUF3267 domain-containing protein [Enterococcus casseliflavus]QQU17754.1 DUF3267 domain-containing protein [Enterococcus casseliflavus]